MGSVRLPKPTPLGWCAAAVLAVVVGTIGYVALHNPGLAAGIGLLSGAAFILAGPRPAAPGAEPAPEASPAVVPAPRAETVAVVPVEQPVAQPVAVTATAAPSLPDPLDQVSLLSAYVQEESGSYQPSYAPEAPTLVARVPGQSLTVNEPDPLADVFTGPAPDVPASTAPVGSWRIGVDILPQSRSTAVAVGDRLGSFRSAVLKARREAKPKPPKPLPGRHRAG